MILLHLFTQHVFSVSLLQIVSIYLLAVEYSSWFNNKQFEFLLN